MQRLSLILMAGVISCSSAMVLATKNDKVAKNDKAVILVHAGYGTPRGFVLRGRVIEDEGVRGPHAERGRWGNLVDSVKTFETDEVVGVRVEVEVGGAKYVVRTDADGVWRVEAKGLRRALPSGEIPLTVSVIDETDYEIPPARGVIYVVDDGPGVAVISDFDDTIVDSRVTSKGRLVVRTLTRNAAQLEPIAGVSAAYRTARAAGACCFFYVSGSPQNLHERIAAFLEIGELPVGPILLKNFGEDSLREQETYKVGRISAVMTMFPNLRFVLVGDSGEKDPEIYRIVDEKFPGRILGIVIRRVPGADNNEERLAGMNVVDDYAASPGVLESIVLAGQR
ncbi:phosphatase domain-containing protein [Myxococcota bacterium]